MMTCRQWIMTSIAADVKTTHIVYGEDMGILAGDALLNYAFETAFKAFVMEPEESLLIGRALGVLGKRPASTE